MLLSRGRAAFFGIFVLAMALPSCFGADGSNENDDDDDTTGGTESSGATGGSSATGGSGPGTGGTGGSGATGGSSDAGGTAGQSGGSGGSGGNVVPPLGGSAGTASGAGGSDAGTGGTAGSSAGTAGTAGTGGTPGAVGSACTSAADCDSGFCLTTESTELDGTGPAGGLCTVVCGADQGVCDTEAPGTICVEFSATASFCLEACETGGAAVPKCQSRPDVACLGIGTYEGTTACETIDDCALGEVCIAAVEGDPTLCSEVGSACVPTCAGDFECGAGQFCDFASGMCTPGSPTGLPIGSACDPAATTDPCSGFCIAVSETVGMCSGGCAFNSTLAGCGYDGTTTPADAICLFLPSYVDPMDLGENDSGLCGPLCDCNDDCLIPGWGCFDIEAEIAAGAAARFGRAGMCRLLAETETLANGIACEQ